MPIAQFFTGHFLGLVNESDQMKPKAIDYKVEGIKHVALIENKYCMVMM